MKKILIVYDCMMTGGTTTALLSFLKEFDYSRYQVDMLMFTNTGKYMDAIPDSVNLLPQAFDGNTRIFSVSKQKILLTLLNGNALRALLSYCKYRGTPKGNLKNIMMHYGIKSQVSISRMLKEQYDVALGFIEGWSDQYVLSNKVKADKRIIWVHPAYQNSYLIPEIDKKLFKKATYIITVSEECKKQICAFFPMYSLKTHCIENIVSIEDIKKRSMENTPSIKRGTINLCTIARCDMAVKGFDRLLYVLSELKRINQIDGVIWHYIGDGRDYAALQAKICEYGLEDHVICYGQINNPLPYLKQMDFFILTSRYEGRPVSVDEAISLNIPCVVTEYASSKEQIDNQVTGIICPNNKKGLYDALYSIITSPELKYFFKENLAKRKEKKKDSLQRLYSLI